MLREDGKKKGSRGPNVGYKETYMAQTLCVAYSLPWALTQISPWGLIDFQFSLLCDPPTSFLASGPEARHGDRQPMAPR